MGKEISWEIRERAEELYIVDGKTFEEVAGITGVSVAQLKRWGAGCADPDDPDKKSSSWTDRKKEYRTAFANIRRDTVLLRKRLIAKALNSLNPQDVFAISSLESMAAKLQQATSEDKAVTPAADPISINTPEDAVDALKTVVERRLNTLLTRPDQISLKAVKELRETLALVEKMEQQYAPGTAKKQGTSAATIDALRAAIMTEMSS